MKMLVTGASGFIGNYVVKDLLLRGVQVVATSSNESLAVAQDWFQSVVYRPYHIIGNSSSRNLYEYFEKPDAAIHLAWSGLPNYKEPIHIEQTFPAQYEFLANLIQNGLRDITISGTCLEYGRRDGCLSEEIAPDPSVAYSVAKDSLRRFLEILVHKQSASFKWVRLFYLWGEGQRNSSLLALLQQAIERRDPVFNMSKGEQLRDYLHVAEAANYICSIALQRQFSGTVNCCSGKPVSIRSLVEDFVNRSGSSIKLNLGYFEYPQYEAMAFWGSTVRLNQILSYGK